MVTPVLIESFKKKIEKAKNYDLVYVSIPATELEKLVSGYEVAAKSADELAAKCDKMIYGACLR